MQKTEEEWKKILTPEQYEILRNKGTEVPFSGKYVDMQDDGMFNCAACGQAFFSSKTKFDSDTGWPSFDDAVEQTNIELRPDNSDGTRLPAPDAAYPTSPASELAGGRAGYGGQVARTEVICKNCGSHLGHLFDDGPTRTGKRYCINSCALDFKPKQGST